jgi:hypothetical protein
MFSNKIIFFILVFTFAESEVCLCQYSENSDKGFSIIPEAVYVSSAAIQLYAFSNDIYKRGITEEISGGYGYGITVRKKIFEKNIAFALSVDFNHIVDNELTQTFSNDSTIVRARVTEDLTVIPVELTGIFYLPDFSDELKLFLGGGFGIYFGDRKRTVKNIQSYTVTKKPGFSLVVLSGFEFFFSRSVSAVLEVKFRQAEYTVNSEFPVSVVSLNGTFYDLEKELNSKIYVDGLKLSLGISYNF